MKKFRIVLPILYDGSTEPKEPKEGDVWQNGYTNKIYVFLGNKWFQILQIKKTGYTKQEEQEMKEQKESVKREETRKLEKYEKILKDFKELMEDK